MYLFGLVRFGIGRKIEKYLFCILCFGTQKRSCNSLHTSLYIKYKKYNKYVLFSSYITSYIELQNHTSQRFNKYLFLIKIVTKLGNWNPVFNYHQSDRKVLEANWTFDLKIFHPFALKYHQINKKKWRKEMREKHCLQKTHFSTAFLVTNQSLNSNYMSNCLTNKLYWQEIKTNLKVNHEKGNTTNYNTIVLLHTIL